MSDDKLATNKLANKITYIEGVIDEWRPLWKDTRALSIEHIERIERLVRNDFAQAEDLTKLADRVAELEHPAEPNPLSRTGDFHARDDT